MQQHPPGGSLPTDPGAAFSYSFPSIRGIQAGREYYVSMCPMKLIPRIFVFDEEELPPEMRAQRTLNRQRIPEMARYLLANERNYVFSALTASIDAEVSFTPVVDRGTGSRLGVLHVPMTARFIINDGQHRRAAIELALRENPELGDETIAVVFFLDIGLSRCQQMFADLNRHAIRASKSLGVLYDFRDELAEVTKLVVFRSPTFRDVVELERSTLSLRSRKLFTLSALYHATAALLEGLECGSTEEGARIAAEYWETVAGHMPEWSRVRDRSMAASEVRRDFIHSHSIVLQALGNAGNALLKARPSAWRKALSRLKSIDWSKSNAQLWEGRAMIGGRVSKASHSVTLTTNVLKIRLGLDLTPEEQKAETACRRGRDGAE